MGMYISSVQFSSVAQSCPTLGDSMNHSTPGLPVHHHLPDSTQTHVHWVGDAIQPSHSLLFPSPPAPIPPSIRVFSNESTLPMRWPKYWSFSFSISPSKEYPGQISLRMHWLDLLAVQGTLKSLLQHHSSKASILQCSAFFIVELSHPYTGLNKNTLKSWGKFKSFIRYHMYLNNYVCIFNVLQGGSEVEPYCYIPQQSLILFSVPSTINSRHALLMIFHRVISSLLKI